MATIILCILSAIGGFSLAGTAAAVYLRTQLTQFEAKLAEWEVKLGLKK